MISSALSYETFLFAFFRCAIGMFDCLCMTELFALRSCRCLYLCTHFFCSLHGTRRWMKSRHRWWLGGGGGCLYVCAMATAIAFSSPSNYSYVLILNIGLHFNSTQFMITKPTAMCKTVRHEIECRKQMKGSSIQIGIYKAYSAVLNDI